MAKFTIKRSHLLLAAILIVLSFLNVMLFLWSGKKVDWKKLLEKTPKLNVVVITEPSCPDCFDLTQVVEVIESQGAKVRTTVLKHGEAEAQKLIEQHAILYLPAFVISGDINSPSLKELWTNFGEIKNRVVLFARQIPPYYELATAKIHGQFEIIYLTDQSCASCYDVATHGVALKNLGLSTTKITTWEATSKEAKDMIRKYKIISLPTVLLKGDLSEYMAFQSVWTQVGTKEADGTYVFREIGQKQMGTYKDLKTGQVIPQEVLNTEE